MRTLCWLMGFALVFISAVTVAPANDSGGTVSPVCLRCEYRVNPLGIDSPSPRLNWILTASDPSVRGVLQSSYQILASSSPDLLAKDQGDLWDTGKVASDQMNQIAYQGKALASTRGVWWKVRIWAQAGNPSAWSTPAQWTMGLLTDFDWSGAKWIGDKFGSASTGYHAVIANRADSRKWVQVDLGKPKPISTIRLYPVHHADQDGFGFPLQFTVEVSNDIDFKKSTVIARQSADFPNPGIQAGCFDCPADTQGRYVRVTVTKLVEESPRQFCFALRQIEVISYGKNVAEGMSVTAQDSLEENGWS